MANENVINLLINKLNFYEQVIIELFKIINKEEE